MKISIITAVRNGEADIARTLQSVAAQTYSPIEHVVIDGASTDGTLAIVSQHGAHVAAVVSEADRGVYDAFNKGLRLATGDLVAFLNAGDVYAASDSVMSVAGHFSDRSVDAVFGDVDIVDQQDVSRVVRRYRSGRFKPERMAYGFMPAHPALFLRRAVYEKFGGFDASYRIAGDFEHAVRVFVREAIAYKHLPQVIVHMPRGGLSNSGWRSKWKITQEMYRACTTYGMRTGYLRLSARFPLKLLEVLGRDE